MATTIHSPIPILFLSRQSGVAGILIQLLVVVAVVVVVQAEARAIVFWQPWQSLLPHLLLLLLLLPLVLIRLLQPPLSRDRDYRAGISPCCLALACGNGSQK
jgi:hypothetical protein